MNTIPRKATKMEMTSLIDTNAMKKGETVIIEKQDHGWVGEVNGKSWYFFTEHLRNENCCKIKII